MDSSTSPRPAPFGRTRMALALAAAVAIGAGGTAAWHDAHAGAAPPAAATAAVATAAPAAPLAGIVPPSDFSQITRSVGPAVVNISVVGSTRTSNQARGLPGMDPDDPFYDFFRRFQAPGGPQREMPMRGQGSGFIVGSDGLILTNAHVVRDAKTVTVKLTDRREFDAKVVGSDPKTDVAVLKIDAKHLPTVALGSSRDLQVGEWVLAIGSPFGFENSVTAGVVSAKERSLPEDQSVPFIQTDVAINPGNSGGPLLNARGEVVGINSQIISRSGGYQGLSFAIPIEVATRVQEQIVATGHANHARLGVTIQDVNQAFADAFKLERPEGALVSKVEPGSPAEKAGLKAGDVVRSLDGQPIVASGDLSARVGLAAPGTKVQLEVWRDGKAHSLSATLGAASDPQVADTEGPGTVQGGGRLGLALRPLQPQEQRQAGTEGGLVVEQAGGPAAGAGVQAGDVLLAINGTPVRSVEQAREVVQKSEKSVALLIQRGDERIFVPVPLG